MVIPTPPVGEAVSYISSLSSPGGRVMADRTVGDSEVKTCAIKPVRSFGRKN
jgi:hypothetical protein